MALAGRPTVILRKMDVVDLSDMGSDDADRILLLDIAVERIIEQTVVGSADLTHDLGRIRDRVEHVTLEAVERLDRELDVALRRVGGRLLVHAHDVGALTFVGDLPLKMPSG